MNIFTKQTHLFAYLTLCLFFICTTSVFSQTLEGSVTCHEGTPLANMNIGEYTTDDNGIFTFETNGDEITISPTFVDQSVLAFDAYDLMLMQSHILGINWLPSPYAIVAADVNNSQSITALDIVLLRRAILGIENFTETSDSWKFIDANYVFPTATNPWAAAFPTEININEGATDFTADFIGLKMGDLRAGCGLEVPVDEDFQLSFISNLVTASELTLEIRCANFNDIGGFQFEISYPEGLILEEVVENTNIDSDITHNDIDAENKIAFCWSTYEGDAFSISQNEFLYQLTFSGTNLDQLGDDFIQITIDRIRAEAYRFDGYTLGTSFMPPTTLICPQAVVVDDVDGSCDEDVQLMASYSNPECVAADYAWTVDVDSDGSIDFSGVGTNASGTYPLGVHTVTFSANECDGLVSCSYTLEVKDITPPFFTCTVAFAAAFDGNDIIVIEALQFSAFLEDCSEVEYRINKVPLVNGSPSFLDAPTDDFSVTLNCPQDLGETLVQIWAIDAAGNYMDCASTIFATDPDSNCELPPIDVLITCPDDSEMFSFEITPPEYPTFFINPDFALEVGANDFIQINGVDPSVYSLDAYDMILLRKHILGLETLSSPYAVIAADLNSSGSLTTFDLVIISQLILGSNNITDSYVPWRFVNADNNFQINPIGIPNFEEAIPIDGSTTSIEFKAIKMGDMREGCALPGIVDEELMLRFEHSITATNTLLVNIVCDNFTNIAGTQFEFEYPDFLTMENIGDANSLATFSNTFNNELTNRISFCWVDNDAGELSLTSDEPLVQVEFSGSNLDQLEDFLELKTDRIRAEAYRNDGYTLGTSDFNLVGTEDLLSSNGITFFQNEPNPFIGQTSLQFELPTSQVANIDIYDATGKLVYKIQDKFQAGKNELIITANNLGASGIFLCRLSGKNFSLTQKLVRF